MRYDPDHVLRCCEEIGLRGDLLSPNALVIELAEGVRLIFQNLEPDDDCVVGFEGTPSHTHGAFTFVDGRGHYVEMDYLEVIAGLADGRILVCERSKLGAIVDRWLIHRDYNDEFKHLVFGEQIRVWRPTLSR
jgi:hypothetical protein